MNTKKSIAARIIMMTSIVFGVIHIGACTWFYIGVHYQVYSWFVLNGFTIPINRRTFCMQYWYPNSAISWYYVSPALESISYTDHTNKNGLQPGASVLERYVISFYWVAATFTANGYGIVKTHGLKGCWYYLQSCWGSDSKQWTGNNFLYDSYGFKLDPLQVISFLYDVLFFIDMLCLFQVCHRRDFFSRYENWWKDSKSPRWIGGDGDLLERWENRRRS